MTAQGTIEVVRRLSPREKTLTEMLTESDAKKLNGNWVPSCGHTEVPFLTRSGRTLLYCYQATTSRHAYLDCGTDLILSDKDASLYLWGLDILQRSM